MASNKWTRTEYLSLCRLITQYGGLPGHTPDIVFDIHMTNYDRTRTGIEAKIKDYVWGHKQHSWQHMGGRREW